MVYYISFTIMVLANNIFKSGIILVVRNGQFAHMAENLRSNIPRRGIYLRSTFSIGKCAATGSVVGYKNTLSLTIIGNIASSYPGDA